MKKLSSVIFLLVGVCKLTMSTHGYENTGIRIVQATVPSQLLVHQEVSGLNLKISQGRPQLDNYHIDDKKAKTTHDTNMKLKVFVTPTTETDCLNSVVSLYSQSAITSRIDGSLSYMSIGANTSLIKNISYASGAYASVFFRHAWLYGLTCSGCKIQFYFGSKGVESIEGCYDLGQFSKLGSSAWYVDWTYNTYVQPGCTLFYANYDTALGNCGVLTQTGLGSAAIVGAVWGSATIPPTSSPTVTPTIQPSAPTITPTRIPTFAPSFSPMFTPSVRPSITPSVAPSYTPTKLPTFIPSYSPSKIPSVMPSYSPSIIPTLTPTSTPSVAPVTPTKMPTVVPTSAPSSIPTTLPSLNPNIFPTPTPTVNPTLSIPTREPTKLPTAAPSISHSIKPTDQPSILPSQTFTIYPITFVPTITPTYMPTGTPSISHSIDPTNQPVSAPSVVPTPITHTPTSIPTSTPFFTESPTADPSVPPTIIVITNQPSSVPIESSVVPSLISPSSNPSLTPQSLNTPSSFPSNNPSDIPSQLPSMLQTDSPSYVPIFPTNSPTPDPTQPSSVPTARPTTSLAPISTYSPTAQPTGATQSPTITNNASSKSVQSNSSNVMVGVEAGAAIAGACCCLILFLLFWKRTKSAQTQEPVGTQDLKSWIQQDEESSNGGVGSVRVANWKKNQLVAIGSALYLSPRAGESNTDNNNTPVAAAAKYEGRSRSGSPVKQNVMPVQETETLHSIQQQLHSLSGVNPLTIQTAQTTNGGGFIGGESIQNPLRATSNLGSSSPPRSPLRSSVFGTNINTSNNKNMFPERSIKNPIHSSSFISSSNEPSPSKQPISSLKDMMMTSIRSSTISVFPSTNNESTMVDDKNNHGNNNNRNSDDIVDVGRPSISLDMGAVYKNDNQDQVDF